MLTESNEGFNEVFGFPVPQGWVATVKRFASGFMFILALEDDEKLDKYKGDRFIMAKKTDDGMIFGESNDQMNYSGRFAIKDAEVKKEFVRFAKERKAFLESVIDNIITYKDLTLIPQQGIEHRAWSPSETNKKFDWLSQEEVFEFAKKHFGEQKFKSSVMKDTVAAEDSKYETLVSIRYWNSGTLREIEIEKGNPKRKEILLDFVKTFY